MSPWKLRRERDSKNATSSYCSQLPAQFGRWTLSFDIEELTGCSGRCRTIATHCPPRQWRVADQFGTLISGNCGKRIGRNAAEHSPS